eukprot:2196209-Amphidinium_carterae.1
MWVVTAVVGSLVVPGDKCVGCDRGCRFIVPGDKCVGCDCGCQFACCPRIKQLQQLRCDQSPSAVMDCHVGSQSKNTMSSHEKRGSSKHQRKGPGSAPGGGKAGDGNAWLYILSVSERNFAKTGVTTGQVTARSCNIRCEMGVHVQIWFSLLCTLPDSEHIERQVRRQMRSGGLDTRTISER